MQAGLALPTVLLSAGLFALAPAGCRTGAAPGSGTIEPAAQESTRMNDETPQAVPPGLRRVELHDLNVEAFPEQEGRVPTALRAPTPSVTFEVFPTQINVAATIPNPGNAPLVLYFRSSGYGDELFAAYLLEGPEVRLLPQGGPSPGVFAKVHRLTIPPKTAVVLRAPVNLGQFEYAGEPEGKISWTMTYANWVRRQGELPVRLPRRTF
jgi:hypothetical protein